VNVAALSRWLVITASSTGSPRPDEHAGAVGEPSNERSGRDDRGPDEDHPPATEQVGETAAEQHQPTVGQQIRRRNPLQRLHREAERDADVRQRDVWLDLRATLPAGAQFCVLRGPTRGQPCAPAGIRSQMHHAAQQAGVRRRFATARTTCRGCSGAGLLAGPPPLLRRHCGRALPGGARRKAIVRTAPVDSDHADGDTDASTARKGYLSEVAQVACSDLESRIILPPGDYSLLVLASNLRSVDHPSWAMVGDDRYRVVLWPGPVLSRRVLRRGLRRN
jgi:hypothetical protein